MTACSTHVDTARSMMLDTCTTSQFGSLSATQHSPLVKPTNALCS